MQVPKWTVPAKTASLKLHSTIRRNLLSQIKSETRAICNAKSLLASHGDSFKLYVPDPIESYPGPIRSLEAGLGFNTTVGRHSAQ
ncbi:hypothetical protein EAI_12806 [Harpegnathos saltator]|uniref:Uncharacterized protein n=1 Tax=Harpegnathos saltator TaxID=610380 RepID=E2BK57_HARSA|nr:hypothetical protein EAI_12806 [Harpegnathos saltator]